MEQLDRSVQLLVATGLVVLTYAFVLGIPLAAVRRASPQAPRALVTAHLEMLLGGPILLSVAATMHLTATDTVLADLGAAFLSAGVVLLGVGGTLNWLLAVDDQFAERSAGWRCNTVAGPVALVGLGLVSAGVLSTW